MLMYNNLNSSILLQIRVLLRWVGFYMFSICSILLNIVFLVVSSIQCYQSGFIKLSQISVKKIEFVIYMFNTASSYCSVIKTNIKVFLMSVLLWDTSELSPFCYKRITENIIYLQA